MPTEVTNNAPVSNPRGMRIAGWIISSLVSALMLFSGGMNIARPPMVVENTTKMGYSESILLPLGVITVISVLLYLAPPTSLWGAILLTAYFGGAVDSHLHAGDPIAKWSIAVGVGVLTWVGLMLRSARVRALVMGRA